MEKLSVERMIELESWLDDNRPDEANKLGVRDYFLKYYEGKEVDYLVDAYVMPFQEIKLAVIRYDSSHPKMDELAFISDLQSRYYMTPFDILRRIREVRRIMTFLSKHPWINLSKNDDALSEDEWDSFLKKDKKCTNMVANSLNYEERRKALALKYDVLRQMVEFMGLSMEDIKVDADKIREEKNVQRLEKKNN